ncbi:MAG: hypothetical protein RML36_15345 [Anaerolineae bacterium]|nr:hypothetical protein [Anaerolineae bacterium]
MAQGDLSPQELVSELLSLQKRIDDQELMDNVSQDAEGIDEALDELAEGLKAHQTETRTSSERVPPPAGEEEPEEGEEEADAEEAEEEGAEVGSEDEMLARIDEEISEILAKSTALRDFISEKYALDLSKYQSDIQLIHGLINAARLIGERSQKAEFYDTLVRKFGQEKIDALIEGRMSIGEFEKVEKELAKSAATAQAIAKLDFDLELLDKVELDRNTGQLVAKPGAPPDAPQKVLKFLEEREKLLNRLAVDPYSVLEGIVDAILVKRAKQAEEYWKQASDSQQRTVDLQQRFAKWLQGREKAIYVGGDPAKGFTAFGNLVYKYASELGQKSAPGTDPIEVLDYAYKLALAEYQAARPQAKTARSATPQTSSRTPAPPAPRRKTQEELILEGLSLAEAARLGT